MSELTPNDSQRDKGYRGVIPFYVLFDLDLNANHLRMYAQIEQMESNPNPKVQPTFSYQWMADVLEINRRNCILMANVLKKKGYIVHTKTGKGKYTWQIAKAIINEVVSPSDTPLVSPSDTPLVSPSDTQKTLILNTINIKEPVPEKPETRPVNSANAKIKEFIHVWNEIADKQGMVRVDEGDKAQVKTAAIMINKLLSAWSRINEQPWAKTKNATNLTPDYLRIIFLTGIRMEWFMLCAKDSVHDIATILAEKNFIKLLIHTKKGMVLHDK